MKTLCSIENVMRWVFLISVFTLATVSSAEERGCFESAQSSGLPKLTETDTFFNRMLGLSVNLVVAGFNVLPVRTRRSENGCVMILCLSGLIKNVFTSGTTLQMKPTIPVNHGLGRCIHNVE